MMEMLYLWGFILAVVGNSIFTLSFLFFTKWWKSILAATIALIFVIESVVLVISTVRFLAGYENQIIIDPSPLLLLFGISAWALTTVYFKIQLKKTSDKDSKS